MVFKASIRADLMRWARPANPRGGYCHTGKTRLDVIGRLVLAATVLVLVYFNNRLLFEPVVSRETFSAISGPIIVLLGCVEALRIRNSAPGRSAVIAYCLYFICRAAVSEFWEPNVQISIFQYLVPVWCFFFGIRLCISGRTRLTISVFLVTLAISDLAGIANHYFAFLAPLFERNAFDKTMVAGEVFNRCGSFAGNSLGTGFLSSIGVLLALGCTRWARLLIPMFAVSAALTLSRGSIVMIGTGLLLWAFIVTSRRRTLSPRSLFAMIGGCVLAVATLAYFARTYPEIGDVLVGRYINDMANIEEGGNQIRIQSWEVALQMWSDHPIWGNGFGLLGGSVVKAKLSLFAPESMYLKYLGELGIIGLAVYLAALWQPVSFVWARIRKPHATCDVEVEAVLCCVIAILAGGVFLQNLENDFMAIVFWLLVGMLAGAGYRDTGAQNRQRHICRAGRVICATPS